MELAPGTILDRYEVVRLLSEGGSAHVHLVEHLTLGSKHAMKVIAAEDADAIAAVIAEGRIQARVRHPNVVMVSDVVSLDGGVALVMEFVEGRPLSEVIGDGHPLRRGDVARIFQEVAAGVTAAHREGILHRDIKPANVLLHVSGGRVTARIMDFGIARALHAANPAEDASFAGTPGYMAPEQIEDAATADARADVFSLGCVLYEMCCGHAPFLREKRADTLRATLHGHHIPLHARDPQLPESLCDAVERALAVEPADRFATVSQLAIACEPGFAQILEPPSTGTLVTVRVAKLHDGNPLVRTDVRRPLKAPQPAPQLPPPPPARRPPWTLITTLGLLVACAAASTGAWAWAAERAESADRAVAALDTPWRAADSPIAALYAHAEAPIALHEAVLALQASDTLDRRLAAQRRLIDTLHDEAVHQALDTDTPGARARGQAAEPVLDHATAALDAATAARAAAQLAQGGVVGVLAAPATALLGAPTPAPLPAPTLGAFPDPEPRIAKKVR